MGRHHFLFRDIVGHFPKTIHVVGKANSRVGMSDNCAKAWRTMVVEQPRQMYRYEAIPTGHSRFQTKHSPCPAATTESFQQLSCFNARLEFGPDFSDQTRGESLFYGMAADPKWPLPRRQHRFYAPYWSLCPSALGCAHGRTRPLWRLAY